MKFIHTADWHLDKNNRLSDFEKSIQQIEKFSKEKNIDFILIAGDIFHKRTPDNNARNVFYKFIKDIYPIPVIVLVGTHDVSMNIHSLSPLKSLQVDNLLILDTLDIKVINFPSATLAILSIPYTTNKIDISSIQELIKKLLSMNVDYKIILGHFSVIGAFDGIYTVSQNSKDIIVPKDILDVDGIDYIALGHIHKPQTIGNIRYSGPIERVDFGEKDNEVGFYYIEDKNVSFIPLEVNPMIDLSLSSIDDIEKVELPKNAIIRVIVDSNNLGKDFYTVNNIKNILEEKDCNFYSVIFKQSNKDIDKIEDYKSKSRTWKDFVLEEIEKSEGLDKELLKKLFFEIIKS